MDLIVGSLALQITGILSLRRPCTLPIFDFNHKDNNFTDQNQINFFRIHILPLVKQDGMGTMQL